MRSLGVCEWLQEIDADEVIVPTKEYTINEMIVSMQFFVLQGQIELHAFITTYDILTVCMFMQDLQMKKDPRYLEMSHICVRCQVA